MELNDRLFFSNNLFMDNQLELPMGKIYQVSELSVIRGGEIPLHCQFCDEITYVISGSAKVFCGDVATKISEGQIHFIRKGNYHRIEVSKDENFRYICIGFIPNEDNPAVSEFIREVGGKDQLTVEDNGTMKALSELLIREFYSYDENAKEMINHYLMQIIITLKRIISGKAIPYRDDNREHSASYVMYRLLRIIDREFMQITNVSSLAERLSYSEYYLSHLFKEKMGITIKEYLVKKKISRASELLSTTALSVEEIAETIGFSSAHSFRRAFKQYTGITPSDLKNKKNN